MHKRDGAQEPRCARSEGRRGAVGFYLVVAATTGTGGVIYYGAWLYGRMSETPLRRTHPIRRCGVVLPSQSTQCLHFCTPSAALGPAAVLLSTAQGARPPFFPVVCNFVECASCQLGSFDDGVDNYSSTVQQTVCDRCLECCPLVSRSLCGELCDGSHARGWQVPPSRL